MKTAQKGPPRAAAVQTPYGLKALVEASHALAASHVISDITDLVRFHMKNDEVWGRFTSHTGWLSPGKRIGMLDFSFHMAQVNGTLEDLRLELLVQEIVGGDGEPLTNAFDDLVRIKLKLDPAGWGELLITWSHATTPEWAEWMNIAKEKFRKGWEERVKAGKAVGLTTPLGLEPAVREMMAMLWDADFLKDISRDLGLDLVVIDEEEEAEDHCSSLDMTAQQIHLVTPWLATELKKRGQMADIVLGLPLWSRDNRDEVHLEPVMQDLAYLQFAHSPGDGLASSKE